MINLLTLFPLRSVRVTLFLLPTLLAAQTGPLQVPPRPDPVPVEWNLLIGEYLTPDTTLVYEDEHSLYLKPGHGQSSPLLRTDKGHFVWRQPDGAMAKVSFEGEPNTRPSYLVIQGLRFPRRVFDGEDGSTFTITPLKPASELRRIALSAKPPKEKGPFERSELVEVTTLDPTIHRDIRYASTNNFMKMQFYSQPLAFLQKKAAAALVRANAALKPYGYGLLIHDAYRPWYVTKMFWEATPSHQKLFVANPAQGSRHNRGCAVDLTLYDLATGDPVEMVSGYDEFSERAYPAYPGGTSVQRWHRALLRTAMEREGFKVYEWEWWHFDFTGWKRYPIGTKTFEEILGGRNTKGQLPNHK